MCTKYHIKIYHLTFDCRQRSMPAQNTYGTPVADTFVFATGGRQILPATGGRIIRVLFKISNLSDWTNYVAVVYMIVYMCSNRFVFIRVNPPCDTRIG